MKLCVCSLHLVCFTIVAKCPVFGGTSRIQATYPASHTYLASCKLTAMAHSSLMCRSLVSCQLHVQVHSRSTCHSYASGTSTCSNLYSEVKKALVWRLFASLHWGSAFQFPCSGLIVVLQPTELCDGSSEILHAACMCLCLMQHMVSTTPVRIHAYMHCLQRAYTPHQCKMYPTYQKLVGMCLIIWHQCQWWIETPFELHGVVSNMFLCS